MGQLILCRTKRAKEPYYFENNEVWITSLEELMYYIQSSSYVAKEDFLKEDFCSWVENQLEMQELAELLREKLKEKAGLKEFFLPIEAANGYLTTSELQILNVKLKSYDHMTGLEAKKVCADHYMEQKKYVRSIRAYEKLLYDPELIQTQGHVAGDIWHNLGSAYARLFDFQQAVNCYIRAYQLNHRSESLMEAVDAAVMSEKEELLQDLFIRFQVNSVQITKERDKIKQLIQIDERTKIKPLTEETLKQWVSEYCTECCE